MRVHRLEIEAFGPFAGRVVVDVDALSADGLFLIHGPTGSGKTSLLDAICFALYADVPGSRSKRGLRSDHAGPDAVPRVTLELTAGTRRLRLTRSPEFHRPRKRGTGLSKVQAAVTLEERTGGRWLPLSTRHDEVADVVKDALGMGMAQFAKVVLLPQGEFAAFLRATPEDRREVLERLFDITAFSDVEAWLAETRRTAGADLEGARSTLATALARLEDVLAEAGTAGEGEEPLGDLAPELVPARVLAVAELLGTRVTTTMTDFDAAQGTERAAAETLAAARALDELRTRGRRARARLEALEAAAPEHDEHVRRLAAADRAAALAGHLTAHERALADEAAARTSVGRTRTALVVASEGALADLPDAEVPAAASTLSGLDATVTGIAREVLATAERGRRHDALVARAELLTARGDQLATLVREGELDRVAAAEQVEHLAAAAGSVGELELRLAGACDRVAVLDTVEADLARAAGLQPRRDDLRALALDRRSALLDLRQRRLDGMAAELAGSLAPGDACPVCGGVEHPHPAQVADPVRPDDVAAAEDDLVRAEAALAGAEHELGALLAGVDARRATVGDADRSELVATVDATSALLADARRAVVEHGVAVRRLAASTAAVEGHRRALAGLVATGESVAAQVEELVTADTAATARVVALHEAHRSCPCGAQDPERHLRVSAALTDHLTALGALGAAGARTRTASDDLAAALDAAGFDDAAAARGALLPDTDLRRLREAVGRHVEELAGAHAVAADPEVAAALDADAPDLPTLAAGARTARDTLLAAAAAQDDASRALRGVERLLPLVEDACAVVVAAATRDARVRDLADTTSGIGPDNTLRMRLTAYVLAARLEKVATLANERLCVMGAGRYVLEHSDERAARGARSGLGLRVLDQWTGRVRDTATLSGGESFMASLALALGLADAVREEVGGLDLGTLFIDEGFGSLDDDSLEQVLTVLDSLREGGRAVGVVSHVADLRARVTHQAVVHKGAAGSTVEVRVGGGAAEPAA
ncbi:MAG TPA: AAA family ATPase [Ornithinibacter sp.]|nr:AAA family ATPase [Ornithinibacter sp.]